MMNRNHYEGRHSGEGRRPARRRSHINVRLTAIVLATVTLLALAVGGTIAWIKADTTPVQNTFTYAKVTTEIEEGFDGSQKTNVNVKNTGDTEVYVRVKLVSYRTDKDGNHIGGETTLPTFALGQNWVPYEGFYYYTLPVAPNGGKPAANLTDEMILNGLYNDADGGYQSIDVVAEAIQSTPMNAMQEAWGVTITPGKVTPYTGN